MAWLRALPLVCLIAAGIVHPALADVLIGVAVPLRGPDAGSGADIARAVNLAAERLQLPTGASGVSASRSSKPTMAARENKPRTPPARSSTGTSQS